MLRSLAVPLCLAALASGGAVQAEPLRLAGRAFGQRAEIEIRDLAPADAERAIRAAFEELENARAELRAIEATAEPGVRVQLDERQAELVRRALGICEWSGGAVGPLGAELFRLWGLRFASTSFPVPDEIERAVATARCERAAIDPQSRILTVAEGSRLDFFPFETGWAVDRAAATLRTHGAENFWIEVGSTARAAGGGPDGHGWSYEPPLIAGQVEPLAPFALRDRAVVLLRPGDRPLRVAGESFAPYIDLRRGHPGSAATLAVLLVSELAVDARAVGYAMFALGPREGTLLLGSLTPRPSIRWLLGNGDGPPVLADVHWSSVSRP